MTKQEAIDISRDENKKITHSSFLDNEYIQVIGIMVFTEEGYSIPLDEFFSYRQSEYFNLNWSIYNGN